MSARAAAAPRGALWLALVLSLAGAVLSILLVRVHAQAHAGIESFCAISDVVNCDRVAMSRYAIAVHDVEIGRAHVLNSSHRL